MTDHRGRVLGVLLTAVFASMICVTIANVALPSLRHGLGAGDRDLQWVLAGYALTYGLLLIPAGRAGDLFGHARVFRLGLGLFTLAALLAAFASTPLLLILARVLMGVGAGLFNPQVIGLIHQLFPQAERARAFGLYGAVTAVGAAIGPVIGGLLLTALPADLGWRATFAINVPLGLVALVLALRWLPSSPRGYARVDLDPIGVLLLAGATACLMVPFITHTWWLLLGTLVFGAAFGVWERAYARRGRSPMVDLHLFAIRSFSAGVVVFTFFLTGTVNVYVIQTLFIQQGLGRSALLAGLVSLPPALVTAWGSALGSRLLSTRLGGWTVPLGLVTLLLGVGLTVAVMFPISRGASVWWNAVTMSVLGIGMGMVMSSAQTLAMAEVPVEAGGTAGGILQTGQRVGSAVGMAMIPGIWFAAFGLGPAVAHAWAYAAIGGFALLALGVSLVARPGSDRPPAQRQS